MCYQPGPKLKMSTVEPTNQKQQVGKLCSRCMLCILYSYACNILGCRPFLNVITLYLSLALPLPIFHSVLLCSLSVCLLIKKGKCLKGIHSNKYPPRQAAKDSLLGFTCFNSSSQNFMFLSRLPSYQKMFLFCHYSTFCHLFSAPVV